MAKPKTFGTIACPGCGAKHPTTQSQLGAPKLQTCAKCGYKWHPPMMGTPGPAELARRKRGKK